MLLSLDFNSHAHVERDLEFVWDFSFLNDFNSHAHVERDVQQKPTTQHPQISTHTLTWSVTRRSKTKEVKNMISTHTLTWSVTVRHAIESREE